MTRNSIASSVLVVKDEDEAARLYGHRDLNLRMIEEAFGTRILARGTEIKIVGDNGRTESTRRALGELLRQVRGGQTPRKPEVMLAISQVRNTPDEDEAEDAQLKVDLRKRAIRPKTPRQRRYLEAIENHDIVFGIGPAGTGKTYLAMASAVKSLERGDVSRIILARPAVEAGESLGFLPGDMYEKVNPYLRPLYDALYDMMEVDKVRRLMARGVLEIAPLAFMRGRTLNSSFIILDEAQNTTREQMKMFLTRLGYDSKTVVTGDITQIDLPSGKKSGLVEAQSILRNIEGISLIYFNREDVVRHPLVQDIVEAYERAENPLAAADRRTGRELAEAMSAEEPESDR